MAKEQLHTFLFADISGYSRLTERHGDEAAAELALRFESAVSEMAAEHGAEVIKRMGDAVLVRGDSPADTVRLGLRIHAELDEQDFPPIHAGIHTGAAVERAGEWWGATVNIAARVAAEAEPGQLLITEASRRAAGEMKSARVRTLGLRYFKNISSPIAIHAASSFHGDLDLRRADRRPMPVPALVAAEA